MPVTPVSPLAAVLPELPAGFPVLPLIGGGLAHALAHSQSETPPGSLTTLDPATISVAYHTPYSSVNST